MIVSLVALVACAWSDATTVDFLVVAGNSVIGKYSSLAPAKEALNAFPAGASTPSRLVLEVRDGVVQGDPHTVGGENQGGGLAAGFNKWWLNWNDIHRMVAIGQAFVCDLTDAKVVVKDLTASITAADKCEDAASTLKDAVDDANDVVEDVGDFVRNLLRISNNLGRFERVAAKLAPFTDRIPKVGTVIKAIRRTFKQLNTNVGGMLSRINSTLVRVERGLDTVSKGLGRVVKAAEKNIQLSTGLRGVFERSITCSQNNDCVFAGTINGAAEGVSVPAEAAETVFTACEEVLTVGSFAIPSFSVDLQFLNGLDALVAKLRVWVEGVVDGVMERATYALCCDNFLRGFKDIVDGVGATVDLATCWVDPLLDAALTAPLAQLFNWFRDLTEGLVNNVLVSVNNLLRVLNGLRVPGLDVQFPVFDDVPCTVGLTTSSFTLLSFDGIDVGTIPVFEYPRLEYTGSGDFGAALEKSCDDAWAAFTSSDEVDCCDLARTCAADDPILLYEGNSCTQNIAGTLSLPSAGQPLSVKTSDKVCLANDEARSVKFFGPMPAGLLFEVGDTSGSICTDDYAAVVLTRALGEDESLCVRSFESAHVRSTQSGYTLYYRRFNGLDGKISQYRAAVSVPPTPRCPMRAAVHFYEGNSCTQDVVGLMEIPATGRSVTSTSALQNDEARSMRLVGPMAAGVRIEVADSSSSLCGDDYGSVLLKQALGDYQEVCVSSFEKNSEGSLYAQAFNEKNGLDGKVSQVRILNSGTTSTVLDSCYGDAKIRFYEGNNCAQAVVGNFALPPWEGYTRVNVKNSGAMPNDEARSLKLVGPLPCGTRVIVSDHPDGRPTDDQSIIVLRSSLPQGSTICVGTFESTRFYNGGSANARQTHLHYNGLDGKVSSVALAHPSSCQLTAGVTDGARWGPQFSEENSGYSGTSVAPIVGMWCSTNFCDNKRVLQATASTCRTTSLRWTGWFSEERTSFMSCAANEYVGRMQCKGSRCDELRLGCVRLAEGCYYPYAPTSTKIANDGYWITSQGHVLWQVKCEDRYCGRLVLGTRLLWK